MQLKGNSVLVIGLGVSGRAATAYLLKQGFKVWAVDDNLSALQNLPEMQNLLAQGLHLLHSNTDPCQSHYDLVVVSPGISKDHPWYRSAIQKNMRIIGEAELAFLELSKRNRRCIGITGTNGKT
ncbi:MAG: UDP-N-acetylmuramoyl-L-alanine--D-glutamate ligase, partial [Parachlamydiaceae bacterium]